MFPSEQYLLLSTETGKKISASYFLFTIPLFPCAASPAVCEHVVHVQILQTQFSVLVINAKAVQFLVAFTHPLCAVIHSLLALWQAIYINKHNDLPQCSVFKNTIKLSFS